MLHDSFTIAQLPWFTLEKRAQPGGRVLDPTWPSAQTQGPRGRRALASKEAG